MKICSSFKDFHAKEDTLAVTIGNFDGVHLGHQALLSRLKKAAAQSTVITFTNHPSEILQKSRVTYLTTLPHRLALFEKMKVEELILIPFTEGFSRQTAKDFLCELKSFLPFTHLVLGHDAVIGSDRKKDLRSFCQELNFSLEYIAPVDVNGKIVSSSEIRKCIHAGNLSETSLLLGRPYSIFATVQQGQGKGGSLGFHTANLPVEELTLPPLGVYAVEVKIKNSTYAAVANLGHAPTLHQNRPTCLEVHLIDMHLDLYGKELEVCFHHFLRPEKRFKTPEELKGQISKDISYVKSLF